MAFRAIPDWPVALSALLTITGLIASFAVSEIAHRTPGLRAIL